MLLNLFEVPPELGRFVRRCRYAPPAVNHIRPLRGLFLAWYMLAISAFCVFNSLRRRFVFLSKGILVSLEGNWSSLRRKLGVNQLTIDDWQLTIYDLWFMIYDLWLLGASIPLLRGGRGCVNQLIIDNYRAVKLTGRWNRSTLCNRGWSEATPSACVHPFLEATSERSNPYLYKVRAYIYI